MKQLALVIATLVVLSSTIPARAELVVNGGFETGDLTGWNAYSSDAGAPFNPSDTHATTYAPNTGSWDAAIGGSFNSTSGMFVDDILQQDILHTVPNRPYNFSFSYFNDTGADTANGAYNHFQAIFDFGSTDQTIVNLTNQPAGGFTGGGMPVYTTVSGTFTTGPSFNDLVIAFKGLNSVGFWHVDDVSVTPAFAPTPEPSTWALFGCGGLVLAGRSWLRRRGA
jgi:hypothetical protein